MMRNIGEEFMKTLKRWVIAVAAIIAALIGLGLWGWLR
jgi:hypothetical protein